MSDQFLSHFIFLKYDKALVFSAEEQSGIHAVIKKSRVSLRVRRTIVRHEARVSQLLQGHSAIPTLFGYQRVSSPICRIAQESDDVSSVQRRLSQFLPPFP